MSYRVFGGLRLTLAVMVMAQHFYWVAPPDSTIMTALTASRTGDLAVLGFFVLSGLIVTEAACEFYRGRPLAFAANRLLRIVPPLVLAYLISMGGHWSLLAFDPKPPSGYTPSVPFDEIFRPSNLFANILSVVPFVGDGLQSHPITYKFMPFAWAIQIELQFYVILTVALWVGLAVDLGKVLVVLAFVALLGSLCGVPGMHFACFFTLGGALYFSLRGVTACWLLSVCIAAVCLQVFTASHAVADGPLRIAQYSILAAELAAICLLFGIDTPHVQRFDRMLGELSYPLYLNQYIVLILAFALFSRSYLLLSATVIAAFILAYVAATIVEPATQGIRDHLRGRAIGV